MTTKPNSKLAIDARTGIDMNKVDFGIVDGYLLKLGLPQSGSNADRVLRLHNAMQLIPNKQSKLGNCSLCRGKSHIGLDVCTFCGSGGVTDDDETKQAHASSSETTALTELLALIAAHQKSSEQEAVKKAESDKAKTAPATAPSPIAGQSLVVVPSTVLQSKRAAKAAGKDKPVQQALIATDTPEKTFTVNDLNKSCDEIRTFLNRAGENIYEAAVVMFRVFEDKLWTLRQADDGTQKYANFGEWAETEMPFNRSYAYELTNLPKYFTREQATLIGSTKLTLSLRIDEDERRRLLESGDLEKMSVREVKQTITQNPSTQPKNPERAEQAGKPIAQIHLTTAGGTKAKTPKAKPSQASTPAPVIKPTPLPEPRKPEPITLITCVLPTSIQFELIAQGTDKNKPPKKARDLSDDPIGFITCANGTRLQVVFMKDAEGNLHGVLSVESSVQQADDNEEGDD